MHSDINSIAGCLSIAGFFSFFFLLFLLEFNQMASQLFVLRVRGTLFLSLERTVVVTTFFCKRRLTY